MTVIMLTGVQHSHKIFTHKYLELWKYSCHLSLYNVDTLALKKIYLLEFFFLLIGYLSLNIGDYSRRTSHLTSIYSVLLAVCL